MHATNLDVQYLLKEQENIFQTIDKLSANIE
jgi:hypothetical protein